MLSHELAHWASRVVYCDRSGRAKTCTYKGQHNPAYYKVLSEVHRELGIPKHKARKLESRAGYSPPDGWMSDQARFGGAPIRSSRSRAMTRAWMASSRRKTKEEIGILATHSGYDRESAVALGISRAIASRPEGEASVSDAEIDALATRILERMPVGVQSPMKWALMVTKNWLIDRQRKFLVAQRRALEAPRIEAERRRQEAEKRESEIIAASHRSELRSIIERMISHESPRITSKKEALQYVWYLYGLGMTDEMAAKRMPHTTSNQRYQWKHRMLKMIMPLASPSLRGFLQRPIVAGRSARLRDPSLTSSKYRKWRQR